MLQGNATEAQHALQKLTLAAAPKQGVTSQTSSHHHPAQPPMTSLSSYPAQHAQALLLEARLTDSDGYSFPPQDAVSIAVSHAAHMQSRLQSHASASTSAPEGAVAASTSRGRGTRSARASRQPLAGTASGAARADQHQPDVDPPSLLHKQAHLLLQAYELSQGIPLLHRYRLSSLQLCSVPTVVC